MRDAARREVEMRCRTCAYDLRGLTERRCPECGRGFDPGDPATFLTKPVNAGALFALAAFAPVLLAWPLILGRTGLNSYLPMPLIFLGPISMIAGAGIGGLVAWRSWKIVRNSEPWVEGRWAVVPAIVIGAATYAFFLLATLGWLILDFFL